VNTLVDNDVLVKSACYGLLCDLGTSIAGAPSSCGVLGAARFVVPKAIDRQHLQRETVLARTAFQEFLEQSEVVEPAPAEQELAAELEAAAQALALNLDAGESQLVAILVTRAVPRLLTGDKRAIVAMEQLLDTMPPLQPLIGRVHSLEQAVRRLMKSAGIDTVRSAVCAEPGIDKTLSICFSCSSTDASPASIAAGLESYIADLRAAAERVLES
jgi:hypothetical protein